MLPLAALARYRAVVARYEAVAVSPGKELVYRRTGMSLAAVEPVGPVTTASSQLRALRPSARTQHCTSAQTRVHVADTRRDPCPARRCVETAWKGTGTDSCSVAPQPTAGNSIKSTHVRVRPPLRTMHDGVSGKMGGGLGARLGRAPSIPCVCNERQGREEASATGLFSNAPKLLQPASGGREHDTPEHCSGTACLARHALAPHLGQLNRHGGCSSGSIFQASTVLPVGLLNALHERNTNHELHQRQCGMRPDVRRAWLDVMQESRRDRSLGSIPPITAWATGKVGGAETVTHLPHLELADIRADIDAPHSALRCAAPPVDKSAWYQCR